MTTNNDGSKPADNMELPKKEASDCGPGCSCHAFGLTSHAGGNSGRIRWIAGLIVLIAAGALMARAVMKNNSVKHDLAASEFASAPAVVKVPVAGVVSATNETPAAPATVGVKEIGSLSDLNALAADTGGVFVFLAGKNDPVIKAPLAQMRSAAKTIEAQGQKIGLFMLKTGSRDYEQVARQTSVPVVLAMVKGRGMVPVAGEITEPKLIQGFVAASSGGGCGAGGCGPGGCN